MVGVMVIGARAIQYAYCRVPHTFNMEALIHIATLEARATSMDAARCPSVSTKIKYCSVIGILCGNLEYMHVHIYCR